jgi:hypothetical protein
MKNKSIYILLFMVVSYVAASCNSEKVNLREGDIVINDGDTFDVHIDTHRIVKSIKVYPSNVLQEGSSSVWLNTTDKDSTFRSSENRQIGSIQIYQILKKRK